MEARQLLEEAAGTVHDKRYVGSLVEKWSPWLRGLPTRTPIELHTRNVTAVLFENQMKHLRHMALREDTKSANAGPYQKYIFPLLRSVFPNLIANEIFSVQPMNAPVGAIFYFDLVYGSSKGGTTAGAVTPRDFDKFYSSEYVNGEILITGDGVNFGGAGTAFSSVLAWTPVRPLLAEKGFKVEIKEISATTGAAVQTATDDGTGGFTGDVTAGTINYSNGAINAFKFTAAPVSGNKVFAYYRYNGEMNAKTPEFQMDIKKAPIEVQDRRLKSLWSAEAAEDAMALQGVEIESEMVSGVAQEMGLEIDEELVDAAFQASTGTTDTWDRIPPAGIDELSHLRSITTKISGVSKAIHKKTLRAPANFIVTSPDISALLDQLTSHRDYRPLWTDGSVDGPVDMITPMGRHGQFGIYRAGTLMNKWTVYEAPHFTRDFMLIGLRGPTYMDSGCVFAPYVPFSITPTHYDPDTQSMRKGMRSRYSFKITRENFFGNLRVLSL